MAKTVQQLAEELDFSTKEEYFNYFSETKANGQYGQLAEMLEKVKAAGELRNLVAYLEETGDVESVEWIKNRELK